MEDAYFVLASLLATIQFSTPYIQQILTILLQTYVNHIEGDNKRRIRRLVTSFDVFLGNIRLETKEYYLNDAESCYFISFLSSRIQWRISFCHMMFSFYIACATNRFDI